MPGVKKKCRVISVMSFKGGVGKTSFTANLACALAKLNKKTLAIDSNFSSPTLSFHFGLINPLTTLKDVLSKKAKIEDAIHIHDESNVHIIPTHPMHEKVDGNRLKNEIKRLKNIYEFIILDCNPSLNNELINSLNISDDLVILSTADYPALVSTRWAAKMAKEKNVNVTGIVLNRVLGKKFELSPEDVEEATGLPVLATLPEDLKALESASMLRPLLLSHPSRRISKTYMEIASQISGEEYIQETLWTKVRDFVKERYEIQAREFIHRK